METRIYNAFKKSEDSLNEWAKEVRLYVEEHGGIINTSNSDGMKSDIFAYIWNYDDTGTEFAPMRVKHVTAVKAEDGELLVRAADYPEEWEDESELPDDGEWYSVSPISECDLEPTLRSITDSIVQYV